MLWVGIAARTEREKRKRGRVLPRDDLKTHCRMNRYSRLHSFGVYVTQSRKYNAKKTQKETQRKEVKRREGSMLKTK